MDEKPDPNNRSSQVLQAYERFVPQQLLRLIGKGDITEIRLGDQVEQSMTILFADIRDFTRLSESMGGVDTHLAGGYPLDHKTARSSRCRVPEKSEGIPWREHPRTP